MSDEGNLYARLGQVLLDRERWLDASNAFSAALAKGELVDDGGAELMLGIAFYYQSRNAQARRHFLAALASDNVRESAGKWLELMERESETADESDVAAESETG
jgi:uncharacterized protein HemY